MDFQTIAIYDLDGTMRWCKKYNQGVFFNVIQDSNLDIVAIGQTNFVKDLDGNIIKANPTTANPSGTQVICTSQTNDRKMSIVKVDLSGTILFNHAYSDAAPNTVNWLTTRAEGLSIAEFGSGYSAVGYNRPASSNFEGFMVQININGLIDGTPGKQTYSLGAYDWIGFSDIAVSGSHIVVSGTATNLSPFGANAFMLSFDNLSSFTVASTNTFQTSSFSKTFFVEYLSGPNLFIVPVFYNMINYSGNNAHGDVELHFFDGDFDAQAQPQPPAVFQFQGMQFGAYDLKMGVAETSNGFAVVSSWQPGGIPTAYSLDMLSVLDDRFPNYDCVSYYGNPNSNNPNYPYDDLKLDGIKFWDSDAYVSKFSLTSTISQWQVNQLWESTFDADNQPRDNFPGDIKRQECLYGISTDDASGALVISGNTSDNYDDNYFVKMHNDCVGFTYDYTNHDIITNTTWNTNTSVLGLLTIKAPATLTISGNIDVSFSDPNKTGVNSRIIIEKGARLIVDGATLTNDSRCPNSEWSGINVLGDNSLSQLPRSNQGVLIMRNGAVLDNAVYAITFGQGNWNDFGGLVRATDATFRVKRRAIEFMSYPHTNRSTFTRCTFEYMTSTDELPLPLITAWDNHGATFRGCTFRDNTGINEYDPVDGNAFFSIDATYTIMDGCSTTVSPCPATDVIRSRFENFNQGVYATGSAGPSQTVSIENTDFIDNSIAVRVEGLDNVRLIKNNVENGGLVKTGYLSPTIDNQFGAYIKDATGYEIEQNEFEKTGSLEPTTGLRIENSGLQANEVYNNTFKGNDYGQRFEGRNRSFANNFQGLQTLCNTNPVSNSFDIEVDGGFFDGIRVNQGAVGSSAANQFSSAANFRLRNTSGSNINYHYNGTTEDPAPFFGPVVAIATTTSNVCNSNYLIRNNTGGLQLKPNMVADYYTQRSNYDNLLYTYYQNIDNGNTDSLLQVIQLTFPSQAQQLRDELIAESPYLSQAALMDAAATGILTDALLLEICLANPEATYGEAFLNFVEFEIPNPLPANMVQLIYQSWGGSNPRTILENQLAELNGDLGRMSNQIIHYYAEDTLDWKDSIKSMIASRKDITSKYQLVEIAVEEEQFTLALQKLVVIANNNDLTQEQMDEHTNLETYVAFRQAITAVEKSYMQLNEGELVQLRTIANAVKGRTATLARNILCFGYGECESENETEGEPLLRLKAPRVYDFNTPVAAISQLNEKLKVFPNPAKEAVTINIGDYDEGLQYRIQLLTMEGKLMLEKRASSETIQINVANFNKGTYLIVLIEGDKRLESVTLVKE